MKRKFNTIKKSRKKSKDIDEKIEYLNKECQKTGLQEVMTTSNIYVGSEEIPNTTYTDVESISIGGYVIGLSGTKGSVGGASIGINPSTNQTGVALSPPHPVTGARRSAYHITTGLGDSTALRPGQITYRGFGNNPPPYTMGGALWFFDSTFNSGEGYWYNLEWGNFPGKTGWGFWDTIKTGQFAGISIFNTNLSQHPSGGGSLGTEINDKISGINFGINGEVGTPTTTIFIKNDLGDPTFLPIDIKGISPQAFDYIKNQAIASSLSGGSYGSSYDVGGGDYRGIDQILRMFNDPDKKNKYPSYMLKNIDQLMIDLDLVQAPDPFANEVKPGLGAKPGDEIAFLPFGGENKKPITKKSDFGAIKKSTAIKDATFSVNGMGLSPKAFEKKYSISPQDFLNLPESKTKFNTIKKSRKKSKDIDEKIEYLNKECQKTGLQEIMTTTGMYSVVQTIPDAPAEYSDVPDPDPVNGITSDDWQQPPGNDADGNPASADAIPTSFPRIWTNAGYLDPTDGLLNKSNLNGDGTELSLFNTDQLDWQDPTEVPTSAVGGVQIEIGGTDPGIVGGYLNSNGFVRTTGQHVRLGGFTFKTHPDQFKAVNYWYPFSIFHPYIESYWPNNSLGRTPQYQGIVKGSENGTGSAAPMVLFTAFVYTGGSRTTYQTSPNTHAYTITLRSDDLGDPTFLPIDIKGISSQAFDYIKNKAIASNYYSPEDKKNVINYFKKKQSDPTYQPKPFEVESLMRQMRAQAGDGTKIAGLDRESGMVLVDIIKGSKGSNSRSRTNAIKQLHKHAPNVLQQLSNKGYV